MLTRPFNFSLNRPALLDACAGTRLSRRPPMDHIPSLSGHLGSFSRDHESSTQEISLERNSHSEVD
ncbi:hypothetical protein LX36DRAFT_49511 [Colletotrichum falcatum]|nr:hypothetical protein LX36DRAFT_49511 [Colletotrichum falcatum]